MKTPEHAPDARISEPRLHEWGMDGYCQRCGRDRFGRNGLRDAEPCIPLPDGLPASRS